MSEPRGAVRHLFTGTDAGFRTVASSEELPPELVTEIEGLVNGFRAATAQEPPCRQIVKLRDLPAYAFTTFTALTKMPDGRDGNYLADTVIVPDDWLQAASWDLSEAFAHLSWTDPSSNWKPGTNLPNVTLPHLRAGALDRLALFAKSVPESALTPLIQAIADLPEGGSTVDIVEAEGSQPGTLEQLVLLSPLLLHPDLRESLESADSQKQRSLSLCTRCPSFRREPSVEIAGHDRSQLNQLMEESSRIFDLAGETSPPSLRGRRSRLSYARWLAGAIREGAWDRIATIYAQPIPGSVDKWYAQFATAGPSPSAVSEAKDVGAHTAATEANQRTKAMAAQARSAAEADSEAPPPRLMDKAWEERSLAEAQVLEKFREHRDQLQTLIRGLEDQLAANLGAAREALGELTNQSTQRVAADVEAAVADVKRGHDANDRLLQRIEDAEQDLAEQRRQVTLLREQIATLTQEPGDARRERAHRVPDTNRWSAVLREAPWRLIGLGLGAASVAALLWWFFALRVPVAEPEESPTVAERLAALGESLETREVAARVLRRALENAALAPDAEALAVADRLQSFTPDDFLTKALVQNVVGTDVDGRWGRGSMEALANAAGECVESCTDGSNVDLAANGIVAACAVRRELALSAESCSTQPWFAGHAFSVPEALRTLELLRSTSRALPEGTETVGSDFLAEPAALVERFALLQGSLASERARQVLSLGVAVVGAPPDGPIGEADLQALEALLTPPAEASPAVGSQP